MEKPLEPAFPSAFQVNGNGDVLSNGAYGMTLRDAFALSVAPTLVEQLELIRTISPEARDHARDMKLFGDAAYRLADALLEARSH